MIRRDRGSWFKHPAMVGVAIIAVMAGAVYLSYTAQNGLPLQSTYRLSVDVPNASEMAKNADVRIGGARVGQVLKIQAEPARAGHPPFARLGVVLSAGRVGGLPVDTRTKIRLASLLGGKYLELTPGSARRTVPDGGRLGLDRAIPIVDVDQAFAIFSGPTAAGLRNVIAQLGDALAGRGTDINHTLVSTRHLLGPLTRVLGTLADPHTGLSAFIDGAASATRALAPLANRLNALVDHATRTLAALDATGATLGQTIEALPPTEMIGTRALGHLRPVLDDAAALARALGPGAHLLPVAARRLDGVIQTTTPVLTRIPRLAGPLETTFVAVNRFARDPASITSITALRGHDLATFATSMFLGLGGILSHAADAQLRCNAIGLWARNVSSALSDGNPAGTWLTFSPVINLGQMSQSSTPSADLHFNPYPREDAGACEAGNERYLPGQAIGHPTSTSGASVELTRIPTGVPAPRTLTGPSAHGARR